MNPHTFYPKVQETPAFFDPFSNLNLIPTHSYPLNPSLVNYQALLLQANTLKLLQLRNAYLQEPQLLPKVKPQQFLSTETLLSGLPSLVFQPKANATLENPQVKAADFQVNKAKFQALEASERTGSERAELKKLIKFILSNINKLSQAEMEKARGMYFHNPTLLLIYDKLIIKYFSTKKCKEDIVRYILRKAFKMMRTAIINKEKVTGKKASLLLCKRYFHSRFEEMEKAGLNMDNEDELLEFIMPYKKNSKNRTMNTNFIEEIFSSEEFCQEYQKFLENFDKYLTEDNYKKTDKLVNLILDCIKKNDFSKLGSFSRLPWLNSWVEDTKKLAIALVPNKVWGTKKQKI